MERPQNKTLLDAYENDWTDEQREAWQRLGVFARRIHIKYAEQIRQLRGR